MNIRLTTEAVEFSAKLRNAFTSGDQGGRYLPQIRTPFNALIADFGNNGNTEDLRLIEPVQGAPRVTRTVYPLAEKSDFHKIIEKIAAELKPSIPSRGKEEDEQRSLETVVEKILGFYRSDDRWAEARTIVKAHIVTESFKKATEKVAFDVPGEIWEKFAGKVTNPDDDQILSAMDAHIEGFCRIGQRRLGNFLAGKNAEVVKAKQMLKTGVPRFAVLHLGEDAKLVLRALIAVTFEPFLVMMLNENAVPKSRS